MTVDVRELTLLTVQETATLLKQSERSIRRKIQRDRLPAIRLGDAAPLRVPAAELQQWLEEHRYDQNVSADGSPTGRGQLRLDTKPAERRGAGFCAGSRGAAARRK